MAKKSKKEVSKTCQECGKKFMGNPLARYCPECRQEIVREKEALQAARPAKGVRGPAVAAQPGGLAAVMNKYLTFTRVAIVNVVILFLIHGLAMYVNNSDSVSLELMAKVEDVMASSTATLILLIWGVGLRTFYWWRESKGRTEWKENYWKQLLTWLCCLIFTIIFSLYLLLRAVPTA